MNGASSLSEVSKAELSANTTLSANANSATSTLGSSVEDIDSVFRMTIQNFMSTGLNGNVGLNKERIKNFKDAIGEYVTDVNNALEKFNAADANQAFGPVIGGKVKDFVASIKQVCQAIVGNLNAFQADLDAVRKAYEAKETSASGAVASTATSISEQASGWTYSGGSN
ncbi:MAG: hypothetical protein II625_04720 [Bacilli bacterium]|nr:hypothetical protein [Bacilli bacterium]